MNTDNPKLLYIEDDHTLASIYVTRMQTEGFEVLHCTNGEAALQALRDFRPDLIVVDLMMPSLSGYDTIDILRNTLQTANTKIVVMSALSQPEDIQKAKDMGADDYIIKSQVMIDDVMKRLHALAEAPAA